MNSDSSREGLPPCTTLTANNAVCTAPQVKASYTAPQVKVSYNGFKPGPKQIDDKPRYIPPGLWGGRRGGAGRGRQIIIDCKLDNDSQCQAGLEKNNSHYLDLKRMSRACWTYER